MSFAQTGLLHIGLVGTPNSGKTSLFNALTGNRQKVANYPGVTVERKEGRLVISPEVTATLIDLPGTYSLRGRSPDEDITRDAVLGHIKTEAPLDLLLCVANSTNLHNCLRLLLELKKTGRPLILVLNMHDIAVRRGIIIDQAGLAAELGIPVVTSVAVKKDGTDNLRACIAGLPPMVAQESTWTKPDPSELRAMQREVDRIIAAHVQMPLLPKTNTASIDAVLLHPVAGLAILLGLLFLMFQAVFAGAAPFMDLITAGFDAAGAFIGTHTEPGLLRSFLQDGVIAGVGGVVIFLPQILILFLFILLLEDFGYMARAAFLMDRIMGGAGLHGRAFIPLLSSFACAIPGIMATRVIDDRRDRLTTILIAPLMTCSARIPVYTLIISAFIPDREVAGLFSLQGLVMFGLYAAGIVSALAVAFTIKYFFLVDGHTVQPFMLELPDYKLPRVKGIAIGLWQRAKVFLKRAGTTIFLMAIAIWFLASFPQPPEGADQPAINYSLAATIGHAIQPVLAPIGFNWQISVALIPGMAAREVMVSALSTVYAVSDTGDSTEGIAHILKSQWSLATALSVLAWYVFAPQCAATLAVIRRELASTKMMAIAFFYMVGLAYIASFITYQVAVMLGAG